ncbi:CLC_0170 family protein [Paenibacillus sp. MMS20-IR301]|uniref:CLC_0170 family protein n=1 Tax=Paenibacillus sp. MMS20-IR301 TaxID=2895946 RepID=UPI0028E1CB44|nr:CLC_0170 family protein [Paenibacillus sp. MMS20-IR301]WNS40947.1 CLC_0170 family protein [Paenibacillus sp. MMS20-IR301]
MVRVFGSIACVLLVSAVLLLTVDCRIYSSRGWLREKKYAKVLGWSYSILFLLILAGLLIYV